MIKTQQLDSENNKKYFYILMLWLANIFCKRDEITKYYIGTSMTIKTKPF